MRKHLALLVVLALSGAACQSSLHDAPRAGLVETSMGFDQEGVQPFLERVAELVETGFTPLEARRLAQEISALAVEDSRSWEFNVTYNGVPTLLRVDAFQDDYEAPDLSFLTSAPLAARIDAELASFAEEQGW